MSSKTAGANVRTPVTGLSSQTMEKAVKCSFSQNETFSKWKAFQISCSYAKAHEGQGGDSGQPAQIYQE